MIGREPRSRDSNAFQFFSLTSVHIFNVTNLHPHVHPVSNLTYSQQQTHSSLALGLEFAYLEKRYTRGKARGDKTLPFEDVRYLSRPLGPDQFPLSARQISSPGSPLPRQAGNDSLLPSAPPPSSPLVTLLLNNDNEISSERDRIEWKLILGNLERGG